MPTGKSSILQLCPQRDSGNCRNSSSLTCSLLLWWQKSSATLEGEDKTKLAIAQISFASPQPLWFFKGHRQNPQHHNWTRCLEINSAAYMRGSAKEISYSSFYTRFLTKKTKTTSISEWYELSISQPQVSSSPSVLFPGPYLWHTTPFPLC